MHVTDGGFPKRSTVHFSTLFAEVYPALLRYAHRLTADPDVSEDVAQEAFVRLAERNVEGSEQELRVWLFRVATNLIRDYERKAKRRRRLVLVNLLPSDQGPSSSERAERAERIRIVRDALANLDARGRELLLMREEGFSHAEMARATGVATGSVGTLLARARRKFVGELRERGYRHDSFF
ncbi:MAG: sigma-70 family RNA polymerase sigma factor [Gammaproteobacteria bacterium]|nr:sigma-70 family RNA polymerase sigma factor [Gammaproteobacteria bacterium]MYH49769.1 sigma-70 family RNA polymerase sigma factor [Gammaproteobacteria bacterium]MYK69188.1 sigma-70 family RNA polymerase sigma factor [Gammaproteobacteria bacterium]